MSLLKNIQVLMTSQLVVNVDLIKGILTLEVRIPATRGAIIPDSAAKVFEIPYRMELYLGASSAVLIIRPAPMLHPTNPIAAVSITTTSMNR